MKIMLGDLLSEIARNHVSFMADGDSTTGAINDPEIPKVISRVNAALRRLYTSFNVDQQELVAILTHEQAEYRFDGPYPHIVTDMETALPVSTILQVVYEDDRRIPLNQGFGTRAVRLRDGGTTLLIGADIPRGIVRIGYKPRTPQFDATMCSLEEEIYLPESLITAVGYGVKALTHENIGGAENLEAAKLAWSQFETLATEAENNTTLSTPEFEQDNRLRAKGFC